MKSLPDFQHSWLHLVLPLLPLALLLAPESWVNALEYQRDTILSGEWWRLWSGHFVHFTAMHAWVNCMLLALLLQLICRVYSWKLVASLMISGPPLISLALMCIVPEMTVYRGASALAALFLAVFMGYALSKARGMPALLLYAVAIAWLAKLYAESNGSEALSNLPAGVHVAWQAHIAGILAGTAAALALRYIRTAHAFSLQEIKNEPNRKSQCRGIAYRDRASEENDCTRRRLA